MFVGELQTRQIFNQLKVSKVESIELSTAPQHWADSLTGAWWFVYKARLRDEAGNIVKWYWTAIDIEDRKRCESCETK